MVSSERRVPVRRTAATGGSPPERRLPVVLVSVVAACLVAACSAGLPSPASDLASGQAVLDLGTMMGQLREENALLQEQLDSLRRTVAYQDTIVRQLAASAGVTMRPYTFPVP